MVQTPLNSILQNQGIKDTISKDITLKYYDTKQDLYLEVNASYIRPGTVLLKSQSDQRPDDNDTDFIPTEMQSVAHSSESLTFAK